MLVVDPASAEVARFWSKVVPGPRWSDCWLWVGAIADDGYGRFWVKRSGAQRVVRPNRYVLAIASGEISDVEVGMHLCDVPICCRVDARHVVSGSQAENLQAMGRKGRGMGGAWLAGRHRGTDRARLGGPLACVA